MKNIDLVDESFDINASASYHLSLELSDEGIRYAIMDTVRKKYIALRSRPFELSSGLTAEEQLKKYLYQDIYLDRKYKSAGLIYDTTNYVLIPNALYGEERKEELFRFTNPIPGNEVLLTNLISILDSSLVFSIPEQVKEIIAGHRNNFKIFHHSLPFMDKVVLEARNEPERAVVSALVFPGFMDIIVFINGNFELFNSFRYKSGHDLIFYILYVFEKAGINPSKEALRLSGLIEDDSDTISKLQQFISEVRFDGFNKNYSYSYTLGQLKEHQFSNLINIASCV